MKVHGNARTCPRSRRLLVKRIEEDGWPRREAAVAAGISERTASKWLARWRAEGEAGLADRSSAPHRIPAPHARPQATARARAAEAAPERCGDRGQPRDAALDGLCAAQASGTRSALPPASVGAAQPLPAPLRRRAAACRRQEARPDRAAGPPPDGDASRPRLPPPGVRLRLRVRARLRRRREQARLRRGAPRRATREGGRLPRAGERLVPVARDRRRAGDDRQATPIARACTRSCAVGSGSGTCAPGPTDRAPTARPSVSSRHCCASGPAPAFIATATSTRRRYRNG
jgi:leucine-zipper of insertion element IS481